MKIETKKYKILKLDRNDAPLLAAAFEKAVKEDFNHYSANTIKEFVGIWNEGYFRKRNKVIIVAKNNQKIIGFVIGQRQWLDSGVGQIEWVWVDNKYRNQGIARGMLKIAEDYYKKFNHHKVELSADNPKTWDVYKKLGYEKEGHNKNGMWHIDTYRYGKVL